jgi:hypothetical protein
MVSSSIFLDWTPVHLIIISLHVTKGNKNDIFNSPETKKTLLRGGLFQNRFFSLEINQIRKRR